MLGDTDSERMFALITKRIDANGGDVGAGIRDAARWIAQNLPVYAINLILTTPDGLWALRYPETHRLFVLQRQAGGTHGDLPLHGGSDTLRVHSEHLSRHPSAVVASEPLDEHPDWRLLDVGELVHVAGDLTLTSEIAVEGPPAEMMEVKYLHHAASNYELGVVGLDAAVQRVALHGPLAGRADQAAEVVDRRRSRSCRRPRRRSPRS